MSENAPAQPAQPVKTGNTHAIILWLLALIAFIVGVLIVFVRHMPFRGSGLGTILIVVGVVLFLIGYLRYAHKF